MRMCERHRTAQDVSVGLQVLDVVLSVISTKMTFPSASSLARPCGDGGSGLRSCPPCPCALSGLAPRGPEPREASFPSLGYILQVRVLSAPRCSHWAWARAPPSPASLLWVQTDGSTQAGRAFCWPWLVGRRLTLTFCLDSCI